MALIAGESAQRQRSAAVVAIADWFVVDVGHDGSGETRLGRGRRRRDAGRKRAEDINLGSSRESPSNVHTDKKDEQAERAVERVFEFEKRRSETEKHEEA